MDGSLSFRPAVRADLPSLLDLYAQLGQDDGRVLGLAEAEALWDRIDAYPDYRIHVAEIDGRVVGTWSLLVMVNLAHRGLPSAVVEDVVVDDSCRGRGIGKRMMREALDIARAKGCYKLALTSNRNREAAHRFYESLGFTRHGHSFFTDLEA